MESNLPKPEIPSAPEQEPILLPNNQPPLPPTEPTISPALAKPNLEVIKEIVTEKFNQTIEPSISKENSKPQDLLQQNPANIESELFSA